MKYYLSEYKDEDIESIEIVPSKHIYRINGNDIGKRSETIDISINPDTIRVVITKPMDYKNIIYEANNKTGATNISSETSEKNKKIINEFNNFLNTMWDKNKLG